jgi:hypothetical protein
MSFLPALFVFMISIPFGLVMLKKSILTILNHMAQTYVRQNTCCLWFSFAEQLPLGLSCFVVIALGDSYPQMNQSPHERSVFKRTMRFSFRSEKEEGR